MKASARDVIEHPLIQSLALHVGLVVLLWLFAYRMTPELPKPAVLQTRMVNAASLHASRSPAASGNPTPLPAPVESPKTPVSEIPPAPVAKPLPPVKPAAKAKPHEPSHPAAPPKPTPTPKPAPEKSHPAEKPKAEAKVKTETPVKTKPLPVKKPKAVGKPKPDEKAVKPLPAKTVEKPQPKAHKDVEKTEPPKEKPQAKEKPLPKEKPVIKEAHPADKPKPAEPVKPEKKTEPKKLSLKTDFGDLDSESSSVANQLKSAEQARLKLAADQALRAEADRIAAQQKADADRLAARQKADDNSGQIRKFTQLIRDRVTKKWDIPPGIAKNTLAQVRITLLPGGEVANVLIIKSSGNHAFDESIKNAIYRASPLPVPEDSALFNQQFRIMPMEFMKED